MAKEIRIPTATEKLEMAIELNDAFDTMCRSRGFLPDAAIMALALQARLGHAYRGDGTFNGKVSFTIDKTGGARA